MVVRRIHPFFLRPSLLRPLFQARSLNNPPLQYPNPSSSLNAPSSLPKTPSPPLLRFPFYSSPSLRSFSSSSGSSNIVLINSVEEFNNSLSKVQDESLHAIFYFTAVWCGPCRMLAPIIEELGKKYPHVTTYKIDIDQESLGSTLSKLQIFSVPTLHFFQKGKKVNQIVGADVAQLKDTMENLYKND
ncbi:hypothetical protein QJS10_CPA09g00865 [Acorus calamus]|uniref:Thioredoxin domain-containing protein n=1 Tax=Acorus calamus TaxID=4465 RepID=A0AAV9E6X1_ACOCL|nr:hypothetical protein QJS10_CPA09g00865 [Acorus calamus]